MGTGERMGNRTYIQEQEMGGGGGVPARAGSRVGKSLFGFSCVLLVFFKKIESLFLKECFAFYTLFKRATRSIHSRHLLLSLL